MFQSIENQGRVGAKKRRGEEARSLPLRFFAPSLLRFFVYPYDKKLSKIPAAIALPITPDTLAAMACMSR